ncbi:MAG: Phosphate transporter family protein [Firmicutes bacterium]|nr:Phosphate transporter family protein [Bacillota bacterium]
MPDIIIIVIIVMALAFDYINGFHDIANVISTSVSTRALTPRAAVWLASILNFLGAMCSTGVAKTIGGDIVVSSQMSNDNVLISALIAALFGAIFWNLITWWLGIPSSSSHALIGGIIGAVSVAKGYHALKMEGIISIITALILSALIAIITGFIIMIIMYWVVAKLAPTKINAKFRRMQILTAAMMSFAHGSNDAQKSMGVITLALVTAGCIPTMDVPTWVKLAAATAMGLGTSAGGWRIIRTMGGKIFKLEPVSGFAADLNSAIVIFCATLLHLPVSTTHVVSGSIMGVGSAKRINAVHWNVAQQMITAWILTIPCSAVVSAIAYKTIRLVFC